MARRELNKVAASGACMKNAGSTVMTRWASVPSVNDQWYTGDKSWTIARSDSDSYILNMGSWSGKTAASYHSGMGLKLYNASGNAQHQQHGYKYIWQNASSSDCGGCGAIFSVLQCNTPSNCGTETGNFSQRIGWQSNNGTNNHPMQTWCGHNADDNRQRTTSFGHMMSFEVPASKMAYNGSSSSGGY